jgi:hypothetical protein
MLIILLRAGRSCRSRNGHCPGRVQYATVRHADQVIEAALVRIARNAAEDT